MNCTLVILLIILVCVFMGTKEGFVDFGLSGWEKPVAKFNVNEDPDPVDMSQYTQDLTDIAPSKIASILETVKSFMKEKTQKCLVPIETIYVNKYTGPRGTMYDTRFMFYDTKSYFVTELMSKVMEQGDTGNFTVSSARTQVPAADASGPQGSLPSSGCASAFLPDTELLQSINPSKSGMEAVLKALGNPPTPSADVTGYA
jgi:hypothetical protein